MTNDDELGAALAFIEMCEQTEMRWALAQNTDGSYVVSVLSPETLKVLRHSADTLEEAVRGLGHMMMREAFEGADAFTSKALGDRLAELNAGVVPAWRRK